ncbi:hypothetical protein A0H81_14877 [Grifola frondosa]|uniref:DUF6570 domain-containing protein n=1 Tax=Grifola frondosa TaxID=5627 RepID=A0A1C7LK98_GRIFR|nr:hypothetical protein A0H81_14877 [Grifola frondosa]
MLVAKVRHNYFIAKVSKGQRKMSANTIMFSQPVARVWHKLPLHPNELDECLAIMFVGSCKPTEADYRCTPFIVRHSVVYAALHWLKLNHPTYEEVSISRANLAEYSEAMPPVGIIFQRGDGTAPVESLAVNDLDEERGTAEGPCTFSVQGLTGKDFATMSYDTKKAIAVRHWEQGGPALAYGHEQQPESIYHNPSLYPAMFPWLFPYGLGGFENCALKTGLRVGRVRAICFSPHIVVIV